MVIGIGYCVVKDTDAKPHLNLKVVVRIDTRDIQYSLQCKTQWTRSRCKSVFREGEGRWLINHKSQREYDTKNQSNAENWANKGYK